MELVAKRDWAALYTRILLVDADMTCDDVHWLGVRVARAFAGGYERGEYIQFASVFRLLLELGWLPGARCSELLPELVRDLHASRWARDAFSVNGDLADLWFAVRTKNE